MDGWGLAELQGALGTRGIDADAYEKRARAVLKQVIESSPTGPGAGKIMLSKDLAHILYELDKRNVRLMGRDWSDSTIESGGGSGGDGRDQTGALVAGATLQFPAGYFEDVKTAFTAQLRREGFLHTEEHGLQPMWTMVCKDDGADVDVATVALMRDLGAGQVRVL